MEVSKYQELAMVTNDGHATERLRYKDDWIEANAAEIDYGGILNASLGLSGEVGELNDVIKKWIFHQHDLDKTLVKKEIGDVCWYIAMMCHSFGYDLSEIMQMNIDKLKARYPEGFDVEKSKHRKEGDI